MPTTYISLCNQVLRRLNEVEIADADFASVRGVHALVKDAIKSAVAQINQAEFGWPFNAASHTQVLTAGTSEYSWPTFYKIADFNSFQIVENATLGSSYRILEYMDRDEWYQDHRDTDFSAGSAGRTIPTHIFNAHGNGFGVTPSPNKAYSVTFKYFLNYSDIVGALYHMYMFKDNLEAAQSSYEIYLQGIKNLQSLYINNYEYIRDTRISR
jgi:hypothetical protein